MKDEKQYEDGNGCESGLATSLSDPRVRPFFSGRYKGQMTTPSTGQYLLDLRVDIDRRYANSPVMNRISGDFYRVSRFNLPGRPPKIWLAYRESWIVDEPAVKVDTALCEIKITGTVRFWKGVHPPTSVRVRIPWEGSEPVGPAAVTFTETLGRRSSYSYNCTRVSDCFRDARLEVDVCQSVNVEPILPNYDTHACTTRPADLPQRTLTIEKAYREAGVCVSVRPDHTVIDDSAPDFARWSAAELHDAMEKYFSQIGGTWPKWELWGLLASTFDDAAVGGIMFDASAQYGGAGEPPERQGFAVFRNHTWFNNLVAGAPANQDEARAMRHFLYTWVHEAGHAFNLLHSWNKARPDALSWMNYDWKYDDLHGVDSFWSNFRFRFDDEELIHIRHGDRASVIMGGDPWASGSHMEAPLGAMFQLDGEPPIELLLRSAEFFEFMEPVVIEFRLRNLLKDLPLELDTRLNPDYGGTIVYVRRPDGRTVEYAPIMCKVGTPRVQTLKPSEGAVQGEDRFSEDVFLGYGRYGFYFDEPGEYLVRAVYHGGGDILIPSNIHRVRVGRPTSKEEERNAQHFFTYQVGMSLYLNGSQSPFLSKGMSLLESMASRYKDTLLGAKVATLLASSAARPFFSIQDRQTPVLKKTHSAEPERALTLTTQALSVYEREQARSLNIAYHQLVRSRSEYLVSLGRKAEAKKELANLRKNLATTGVNSPVLNEIASYEKTI